MVNFLISKGANVNQLSPDNHTPLYFTQNAAIRAVLIAAGAIEDTNIPATDTENVELELQGETSSDDSDS